MEKSGQKPESEQVQILKTLEKISGQLEKSNEHNERSFKLAKKAEQSFFGVAAPYYVSQFILHCFEDKFLEEHPYVKEAVMAFSLAVGLRLAFPEKAKKFKKCAAEVVQHAQKFGQRTISISNERFLVTGIHAYLGYRDAADKTTAAVQRFPQRCSNNVRKIWKNTLTRH